ncbi:MAG TPA: type VI secretion protein IcmF/TssM N-terminal domain-containing protein [Arsenophonus apicola]|uniref:type VI secretion protein IcmF/TssM N-terminal domain-containing protein n=1 Tax=Arsenophonus apicola TaxID=2879119 RepID=UPI00387956CA
MKKFFCIVGILLLLIGLLCLCFALVAWWSWPTLMALWLFLGCLCALLIIYVSVLVIPRTQRWLKQQLVKKRYGRNRLERQLWHHWKHGAGIQKRWRLIWREYAPPWFVVLGTQEAGQQGLLANSQIPSLAGLDSHSVNERQFSCRWWFFRRAMYLVMSSYFSTDKPLYRQAWQRLTYWFSKVRPPTGIVLCVPMNLLLQANSKVRFQTARLMREQLAILQQRLGYRLSVWLLVTHSECLPGFDIWSRQLSEQQRQQVLGGMIDQGVTGNYIGAVDRTLDSVIQALKITCLCQLNDYRITPPAELLILPAQIRQLQPALEEYLQALFEPDHYQQHSLLCGLFFAATENNDNEPGAKSLFSQQLLEKILPDQKSKKQPLLNARFWQRRALYCLLIFSLLFGGARSLWVAYKDMLQLACDPSNSTLVCRYERYQQAEAWQERGIDLFSPLRYLLRQYLAQQYLYPLTDINYYPNPIINNLASRFANSSYQQKRHLILNLARFINSEQAMSQGASLTQLRQLPTWSASELLGRTVAVSQNEYIAIRLAQYRTGQAQQALSQWRSVLQQLLEKDNHWSWLLDDNIVNNADKVTLADFWPIDGSDQQKLSVQVKAIYTQNGEKALQALLDEIALAVNDATLFSQRRSQFISNYHQQYQSAWLTLAQAMPQAESYIRGKSNWQQLMLDTAQNTSPYLRFFNRLAIESEPIPQPEQQSWLRDQLSLWQLHNYLPESNFLQQLSMQESVWRRFIQTKFGRLPPISIRVDQHALFRYQAWRQMLQKTVQYALLGDNEAEQLVKISLGVEHDQQNGNLRLLANQFDLWWQPLQVKNMAQREPLLRHLWQGDKRLLVRFAFFSAAEKLQQQWDSQVIWPMSNANDHQLLTITEQMARLSDYSKRFIQQHANYALNINGQGISRRSLAGINFPLNEAFLHFIHQIVRPNDLAPASADIRRRLQEKRELLQTRQDGEIDPEHSQWAMLTFTSQPASANRQAQVLPIGSRISLDCQPQIQRINSINFNDSATMRWHPQWWQRIKIDIDFPGFQLTQIYSGAENMVRFIRTLSQGELIFNAKDFTHQYTALTSLGIKRITVRYLLEGAPEALSLYQHWSQQQKQQRDKQQQLQHLDQQLLNLNAPAIPVKGSLSSLPLEITTLWYEIRNNS